MRKSKGAKHAAAIKAPAIGNLDACALTLCGLVSNVSPEQHRQRMADFAEKALIRRSQANIAKLVFESERASHVAKLAAIMKVER